MAQLAGTTMLDEPTIRRLSAALGAEVLDLDLFDPYSQAVLGAC
jgi:hypothetical protein